MPAGYQPSLAGVYAAWLGLIVLMYGLTLLWLRWRARRPGRGRARPGTLTAWRTLSARRTAADVPGPRQIAGLSMT
jgi:hypothetical protein